jgi:hypothetical protein
MAKSYNDLKNIILNLFRLPPPPTPSNNVFVNNIQKFSEL